MQPITLGFLTPYSSIYPNYFPHLSTGFYVGLNQQPGRSDIEILPEFAGSGGRAAAVEASKKLLQFANADILSGMVTQRWMPDLLPLIESRKKMGFFFEMGEMVPMSEMDNIFYNSHQLYQSEYALGYWAQKEYRQPGLVVMPIYNSGYHLHRAFQMGVNKAGGDTVLQTVIPYRADDPHHLDIEGVFDIIRKEAPAYVHGIFVGPQGNEFLEKWHSHSWAKSIPLLVAENMLYDDMLGDVKQLGLNLYGAMLWNPASEKSKNKKFVKKFKNNTGQLPNLYALLGYESGLLFKRELLNPLKKRQWDVVQNKLQNTTIEGPRGARTFQPFSNQVPPPEIDIVKMTTSSTGQRSVVVDIGKPLSLGDPIIKATIQGMDSGWANPYLCI